MKKHWHYVECPYSYLNTVLGAMYDFHLVKKKSEDYCQIESSPYPYPCKLYGNMHISWQFNFVIDLN